MRRAPPLISTLLLAALSGCWGSHSGNSTGNTQAQSGTTAPASVPAASSDSKTRTPASWGTDFDAALEEARKRGVPVLADFAGSDWCPSCIRLRREVFDTAEFRAWAAERVVLLEVDFPREPLPPQLARQNERLQGRYGIEAFPTVLLLDGRGEKIGELGYVSGGPTVWLGKAQEILDARRP